MILKSNIQFIVIFTCILKMLNAQTFNNYQLDLGGTTPTNTIYPNGFEPVGWLHNLPTPDRDNFDQNLRNDGTTEWLTQIASLGWSDMSTALLIGCYGIDGYESIKNNITALVPGAEYTWSIEATAAVIDNVGSGATSATLEVSVDGVSAGAYNIIPGALATRYVFTWTQPIGDTDATLILFEGNEAIGWSNGNNPWLLVLGGSGQFDLPVPVELS